MQYPSIEPLKPEVNNFFVNGNQHWILEEKYDGSQLTWYLENGKLVFFNGKNQYKGGAVFGPSINSLTLKFSEKLQLLNPNYSYHGECFSKPKHNVIAYTRVPLYFWICYDIYDQSIGQFLEREAKEKECDRIGVECAKVIYRNTDPTENPFEKCKEFIAKFENGEITSSLGGMVEGVVLKHHRFFVNQQYVSTKKKYTIAEFKEHHTENLQKIKGVENCSKTETKEDKKARRKEKFKLATPQESVDAIGEAYSVKGRFAKAVIHLKEADNWDYDDSKLNTERLKVELDKDFDKECKRDVREFLNARFFPDISQRWDNTPKPVELPDNLDKAEIDEPKVTEEDYSPLDKIIGIPSDFTNKGEIRKFYRKHEEQIKDYLWEKYQVQIKEKARSDLESFISICLD
jgi:hypothetical protein